MSKDTERRRKKCIALLNTKKPLTNSIIMLDLIKQQQQQHKSYLVIRAGWQKPGNSLLSGCLGKY